MKKIYLFVLFIAFWGPPRFGTGRDISSLVSDKYTLNPITFIELLSWTVLGLFVVKNIFDSAIINRKRIFQAYYPINFFLLFGLTALFSTFYSDIKIFTFYRSIQIVVITLALSYMVFRHVENWKTIFNIFVYIAILNILIILITFLVRPEYVSVRSANWGLRIYGGAFISDYGTSGVVIFIITYIRYLYGNRKLSNILLMILAFSFVLLARTRSNIFYLFLFILLVHMLRKKVSFSYLYYVGVGYIIISILDLQYDFLNFIIRDEKSFYTLSGRLVWWENLLLLVKENPFLGVGFMNWAIFGSTHNSYIEVLVGTGLIGLFFFIIPVVSTMKYFLKNLSVVLANELNLQVFFLFLWLALTALNSSKIAVGGYSTFLMIHLLLFVVHKAKMNSKNLKSKLNKKYEFQAL